MSSERPKLFSVAIEVTAHCQQKCDYCYNEWREDNGAEYSHEGTRTIIARATRLMDTFEIDHFTITGGEPFARKDIFEILGAIHARGVGIQIISNGGLIDDARAARLSKLGVRYVQSTLDGPDAAMHDAHVGGDGHFDATLAGVRAMKMHGVPVVGCIVITKKNAHHVASILELWRSLGVHHIALSRFSPAGYAASHAAQLLCSRDDLLVALRQALPFARAVENDQRMQLIVTMPVPPCAVEVEELAPIQFGTCAIGTAMQELALGPDGKLRNCTLHRTRVGGGVDVLDPSYDLASILSTPEVAGYKRRVPDFCRGCMHESTCAGGCGAAAEWVLGDARAFPDPFVWQHVDDDYAARLSRERAPERGRPRRHLETIA